MANLNDSIQSNIKGISDLIGYVQKLKSITRDVGGVSKVAFEVYEDALLDLKNAAAITGKTFVSLTDSLKKAIQDEQELAKFTELTTAALVKEAAAVTKSYEAFEKNTKAKNNDIAISKQLNGVMIESVNAIGKKSDALKQLAGWYEEQQTKQKQAVAELKASLAEQKKEQAAIESARKTRLRNTDAIESNKKALQKFKEETIASNREIGRQIALGNKSTSMFSKLGKTLKTGLAFFGITAGVAALKSLFTAAMDVARQMDSVRFTMAATIEDTKVLGQTQDWLIDITNRYGAELITTTERYTKFSVAAREAGFTVRETQKIFETMTKVAGTLGLKTDELRGIYLALEQMISKGKITTEELRRQLGERLPGAMDIMAKSMGVNNCSIR